MAEEFFDWLDGRPHQKKIILFPQWQWMYSTRSILQFNIHNSVNRAFGNRIKWCLRALLGMKNQCKKKIISTTKSVFSPVSCCFFLRLLAIGIPVELLSLRVVPWYRGEVYKSKTHIIVWYDFNMVCRRNQMTNGLSMCILLLGLPLCCFNPSFHVMWMIFFLIHQIQSHKYEVSIFSLYCDFPTRFSQSQLQRS